MSCDWRTFFHSTSNFFTLCFVFECCFHQSIFMLNRFTLTSLLSLNASYMIICLLEFHLCIVLHLCGIVRLWSSTKTRTLLHFSFTVCTCFDKDRPKQRQWPNLKLHKTFVYWKCIFKLKGSVSSEIKYRQKLQGNALLDSLGDRRHEYKVKNF